MDPPDSKQMFFDNSRTSPQSNRAGSSIAEGDRSMEQHMNDVGQEEDADLNVSSLFGGQEGLQPQPLTFYGQSSASQLQT
mmetsp:Transcript_25326/g.19073  ORF Transcript_25326/g.19073 Transcript_25326/m.19073 type:complete len:80 (-) Transcript_25326:1222-1461(-)